jgi:hypothetical protein
MRDPAVLFYSQDFITGTLLMSDEQRGKYIMLLCLQHQHDRLTEKDMLKICGGYDADIWAKFDCDSEGFYYNKRMMLEAKKRNSFTESRRKNLKHMDEHMDNHMVQHMENENENEIEDVNEKRKYKNIPPQLSEVSARITERGITSFTADAFYAFYESKGWKVGSSTMKNWDAALTTWNNREHDITAKPNAYAPKYKSYDEMCQLALNNKDIWKQMTAIKFPDMPKTVWAHPNDVVKHNLNQYVVKHNLNQYIVK